MTYLVERLAELRRHLDHLRQLRPRVPAREALERNLSLRNDVLFSLLTVCHDPITVAVDMIETRVRSLPSCSDARRGWGWSVLSWTDLPPV